MSIAVYIKHVAQRVLPNSPRLLASFKFVVSLTLWVFDGFTKLILARTRPDPSKILVIRLDRIGDFIVWQGQLPALRRLYPAPYYKLTLLGNQDWTPLLSLGEVVDEVISLDASRFVTSWTYRFKCMQELRAQGFHTAIHPTFSRDFLRGDAVIRLSEAVVNIGWDGDLSNSHKWLKPVADTWYTQRVSCGDALRMELERNADFMLALGAQAVPTLASLPLASPGEAISQLTQDYFVIFPGASDAGRQWPPERFAQLAELIHAQTGWQTVVCGSGADSVRAGAVAGPGVQGRAMVNLAGQTSLLALIDVIRRAKLLVTNDTSAAHIGPAVGTPTVCVLGGGHFGRFFPYQGLANPVPMRVVHQQWDCFGCHWRCHLPRSASGAYPCVGSLGLMPVWQAVQELLPVQEPKPRG